MPVNTPHPLYTEMASSWKKCRDAVAGEKAVKAAGTAYLPQLGGQDNSEYQSYKMRATWYGAPHRTKTALSGALMMRQPTIKYPEESRELLKNVGYSNESLYELMKVAADETLEVGRVGHLVDAREDGRPYIAKYCAERIISWKLDTTGDRSTPVEVRLYEEREVAVEDDPWVTSTQQFIRVLMLRANDDGDFVYVQELHRRFEEQVTDVRGNTRTEEVWKLVATIEPRMSGGRPLNFIPFKFGNVSGSSPDPQPPPLEPLIDVAYSHYRNSADLEHGLHFTALPTPWAAGFETGGTALHIGSSVAWIASDPQARAGYLEFTGSGLGAIEARMKDKRNQMAVLGARMLDDARNDPESGAALTVRASGERSSLSNIAITIGENFTTLLQWVLDWQQPGANLEEVSAQVNKEYGFAPMDANMVTALLMVLQSGGISYATFYHSLQRGGIAKEDVPATEELALIEAGYPGSMGPPPGADGTNRTRPTVSADEDDDSDE